MLRKAVIYIAIKLINVRIKRAMDTHANWMQSNPVLMYGEMVFVTECDDMPYATGIKIGDGMTPYADLQWYSDCDKISKETIGQPDGTVPLDEYGKIPYWMLPDLYTGEEEE